MLFILSFVILGACYYTLTYGISLWRESSNKLGGFGAIVIAVIGSVAPIIMLFLKA